jgi:2-polyprenyl-3-methyl-5-hydroxy-6-metoxy-1,4-benzoquinol methylase
MRPEHESNRRGWNEVTPAHVRSDFYDVPGFLAGKPALDAIELEGVGDVRGKSLLHLQCHFGLSTLDFARRGAHVTGVDFSDVAIREATALAGQCGLKDSARFICGDVLELDQHLNEQFDIVFTSYGVITWLSDLKLWAAHVARCLKPGGRFFIAEIHPFSLVFKDEGPQFGLGYNYFHSPAGVIIPPESDYADPSFTGTEDEVYWAWPLSDIFSALQQAGLTVQNFREYPFTVYQQFPDMAKGDDGYYHRPADAPALPLLFSLSATR